MVVIPGSIVGPAPLGSGAATGPARPPKRVRPSAPQSFVVPGPRSGPMTVKRPLSPAHQRVPGSIVQSFVEIFYNRIYFLPPLVDFSAISADQIKTVLIWNAYFKPTSIDAAAVTSDGTVSLPGFVPGTTLQGLQTLALDVKALKDGASSINGTIVFTVTPPGGVQSDVSLGLRGTRARFLPFSPNMESPYKVKLEYLTDINTSRDGHEQRFILRDRPRKFLDYQVLLYTAADVRRAKALMTSWRGRTFVLPEWSRFAVSSAGMPAGSPRLVLDAVPAWLSVNLPVCLSQDGKFALRTVRAIQGNEVVFAEVDDETWYAGVLLCPQLSGNFPDRLQTSRVTDAVQDLNVVFEVQVGVNPPDDEGAPVALFEGLEVMTMRPNEIQPPEVQTLFPAIVVDLSTGRTARFTPIDFAARNATATFSGMSLDETKALMQFWLRQKGRGQSFYAASWDDDLPPTIPLRKDDVNLRVASTDVLDNYTGSAVFQAFQVEFYTGEVWYRRIASLERIDGDTLIKVREPWPRDAALSEIRRVSWLCVTRFGRDDAEFEFETRHHASAQLTLTTLINGQAA